MSRNVATADTVLGATRDLVPTIRESADEADAARRQPADVIKQMCDAGIYAIVQPRRYGGLELDWHDALPVIEEVSAADGSAGWCLLKGTSSNMLGAYLPESGAAEIWAEPRIVTAGNFNPIKGRAEKVDGGYVVSGQWDWGTGCTHSAWVFGGATVFEQGSDEPTVGGNDVPTVRACFFRQSDIEVLDTWHTHGMRGTGSCDFAVHERFVPEEHAFGGVFAPPVLDGALYRLPLAAQVCVPHAAVSVGIARAAVQELIELASSKIPLMGAGKLADRPTVQHAVAEADAMVRAARALVVAAVDDAWRDPDAAPLLSLAATHATHTCVRAVDLMYAAAGSSAVYSSSPLQRQFHDIHVAASHFLVNDDKYTQMGKAMLGAMS